MRSRRLALLVNHDYHAIHMLLLDDIPVFLSSEHLNIPDIEFLDLGVLNLHHEIMQLVEIIAKDVVLLPAEVLGEVIARTQRKRTKNYLVEVDIWGDEFRQQPIDGAVAAASQRDQPVGAHIQLVAEGLQVLKASPARALLVDYVEVQDGVAYFPQFDGFYLRLWSSPTCASLILRPSLPPLSKFAKITIV